jgi:hypothetical protein
MKTPKKALLVMYFDKNSRREGTYRPATGSTIASAQRGDRSVMYLGLISMLIMRH